ncbi:MAG: DUF302 domain-containing protein [Candidatus Marinimicrobia bacterium]|nr:DUF302 domain-containing protein [Candidatus Neomarinimicrobiota bacterium]
MDYDMTKVVDGTYEETIEKVEEELKKVGFGTLTTIDVKETLKKKIDVDFRKYIILGACNPNLAHRALQSEIKLGLLLPCNVIVYEEGEGRTTVSILNPEMMSEIVTDSAALKEVASEAKKLLTEVLNNI